MSARATERLIGELVIAPGLPNSPLMVVQGINKEAKLVTAVWFSDGLEYQEGIFPAAALERVEPGQFPKKKKTSPRERKLAQ